MTVHMIHMLHLLVFQYQHGQSFTTSTALAYLRGEYAGAPKGWYTSYLHLMTRFHISPTGW